MTNNIKFISSSLMLKYNKLDRLYETKLCSLFNYLTVKPEPAQVEPMRCSTLLIGSLPYRKYYTRLKRIDKD
jgi:hypothetical protein